MGLTDYLTAFKRRWPILVAAVVLSVVIAWISAPVLGIKPPAPTYEATTVLLSTRTDDVGTLTTAATLVTVDSVAARAAKTMGFAGDPRRLGERVEATADATAGILQITATSPRADEATAIADTFAAELLEFLVGERKETVSLEGEDAFREMERLRAEINALDDQIGANPELAPGVLVAERDAKIRQYGFLYERYSQLLATSNDSGLRIIQNATAHALPVGGVLPRTATSRSIIAGFLGLLGGIGIALVLERMDTRIHTRQDAERAFGLPVLGEIPVIPRRHRAGIVAADRPKSLAAESFRLLGAEVIRGAPPKDAAGNGRVQTILVTSPGPEEGKTTVVANLAVTLAEAGRKILILSCDLRRPAVHQFFEVPNDGGLVKALTSGSSGQILDGHVRKTTELNVMVVPTGSLPDQPSELLGSERMRAILREARLRADVVLLDTAPILVASEATYLMSDVDAVLVVARAGKTTEQIAERTSELLRRLGAPVEGVVLNGAREALTPKSYRTYERGTQGGEPVGEFPTLRVTSHPDNM